MKKIVAGILSAFIFVAGVTVSMNRSYNESKINSNITSLYSVSVLEPSDPEPK